MSYISLNILLNLNFQVKELSPELFKISINPQIIRSSNTVCTYNKRTIQFTLRERERERERERGAQPPLATHTWHVFRHNMLKTTGKILAFKVKLIINKVL